jgi:hypothetical protein
MLVGTKRLKLSQLQQLSRRSNTNIIDTMNKVVKDSSAILVQREWWQASGGLGLSGVASDIQLK